MEVEPGLCVRRPPAASCLGQTSVLSRVVWTSRGHLVMSGDICGMARERGMCKERSWLLLNMHRAIS